MSEQLPEKCCGRCEHFDKVDDDNPYHGGAGMCNCPMPPYPMAVTVEYEPVLAEEGEYCECFVAKEKK